MARLRARRKAHQDDVLVLQTRSGVPNRKLLRSLKAIANRLNLGCRECDSCVERDECEHFFLHKFRATYITKLLRSGMDIRTVMKLSGHSDLQSVMRYLSPATDDAIRVHINSMTWWSRHDA
jgi:integrase